MYDDKYSNVISCSSKQVYNFVNWLKEQDFYKDTVIILVGDHLTMDEDFLDDIDPSYERTVYNTIINSELVAVDSKNRKFTTFDIFPTTIASLGIKIEGDRLGLGTNLYSDKKTLLERYDLKTLNLELQKSSDYYNKNFIKK